MFSGKIFTLKEIILCPWDLGTHKDTDLRISIQRTSTVSVTEKVLAVTRDHNSAHLALSPI